MKKIRENAAGIDIGAKRVFVYVEGDQVRSFFTFTEDLEALCRHLLDHRVQTVAMEATGVYWVILYDILTDAGIDVWLVDGRKTKQMPGRKTDVKDCQWIEELHAHGLLNRCFVVSGQVKELRSFQRLREDHLRSASMHVNHMQKALTEMNIRLKEVLSQIHGASGMRIIEAILKGERNSGVLLHMCDAKIIKNKKAEMLKALNGKFTRAGLFALQQAYDAYHFYQKQISECDKEIQRIIHTMGKGSVNKDLPEKRKPVRHNSPQVKDLGANLIDLFDGKDATIISGVTDYTWLQLMAECGTDLSRWETEKHYTSWLGLAPGQHWSGKKRQNKKKQGHPKAGQVFRQIAQSLINSKRIALGAFGRRIRAKKGPGVAIKAVARKLAEMYWRVMVKGIDFVEQGVKNYEEQLLKSKRKTLERIALELNIYIPGVQHVT